VATISITGASGFIGRGLVAHAASQGHRVEPLTREDLANRLPAALAWTDVVIHLAGRAHVLRESAADPARAFHENNVQLTERVLAGAIAAGVRRFVLMSSAGVLGNTTTGSGIQDDSQPRPYDHYSRSKLDAEQAVKSMARGRIETVVIRPPLVYGPGARGNFARIMRAVERGWPLPVGALRAPRSMIGLRNLCDVTLRAALDPRAANATFLVGDERSVSVRELTLVMGRAFGKTPAIFSVPRVMLSALLRVLGRGRDVPRLTSPFVVNAHRVRDLLAWTPPYTLVQEIEWTVAQTRAARNS